MVGGGCCSNISVGDDMEVRALLFEWALVFFDITFLDGIMKVLVTFLSKK